MAFLDDLEKKLTLTGQSMKSKAKEITEVANLKSNMKEEEKKIQKNYENLGERLYKEYKDEIPEGLKELVQLIDSSYEEIKKIQMSIQAIENVIVCLSCGTTIKSDAEFCSECGTRVKVVVEPPSTNLETKFCTSCGSRIAAKVAFCTKCGHKQ